MSWPQATKTIFSQKFRTYFSETIITDVKLMLNKVLKVSRRFLPSILRYLGNPGRWSESAPPPSARRRLSSARLLGECHMTGQGQSGRLFCCCFFCYFRFQNLSVDHTAPVNQYANRYIDLAMVLYECQGLTKQGSASSWFNLANTEGCLPLWVFLPEMHAEPSAHRAEFFA